MKNFLMLTFVFMAIFMNCPAQESGILSGTLKDEYTNAPLFAVKVTVDGHVTRTDALGEFNLELPVGTYYVSCNRYGLYDLELSGVAILAGEVTTIDTVMAIYEVPATHGKAELMDNETWIEFTWAISGPNIAENYFDDGEVDDYFTYQSAGGQVANKFTPYGYEGRHIIGGRIFVGDSTFPGPFLGSKFLLRMYDDEGMSGKPGNVIKEDTVTVDQYGWLGYDSLDAWCSSDNYYLSMIQLLDAPESAPIAIDLDNPTYPDASFMKFNDQGWLQLFEGNAMIRSWTAFEHDSMDISSFRVLRYSGFDPYNGNPFQGYVQELASTQNLSYNDYAVAGMGNGCWAYGVKILYNTGKYSPVALSNTVCKWANKNVSIDVTTSGASFTVPLKIRFSALDQLHEDHSFSMSQPDTGNYTVPRGKYRCEFHTPGFDEYIIDTIEISNDTTFAIQLQEICSPVTQATVYPFDSLLVWEKPLAYLYDWWCDMPNTCHELTTPEMDLTGNEDWNLSLNYYDELGYDPFYVEYSTDRGENWGVIYQLSPVGEWTTLNIPLWAYSGTNGEPSIIFRIREVDANSYDELFLDHVWIWSPSLRKTPIYYIVVLNGDSISSAEAESFHFTGLINGQYYRAGILPKFESCETDTSFVDFTYYDLFPPINLSGSEANDSLFIRWSPPTENWGQEPLNSRYPDALAGYRLVFKTGNQEWDFVLQGELDTSFAIHKLSCDSTFITVTSRYDLTNYGYPGDTMESLPAGPVIFDMVQPIENELIEDWSSMNFYQNCWTLDGHFMAIVFDAGNPGAAFVYNTPLIPGYTASLISHPMHMAQSGDWNTVLEFDLKLQSDGWSGNQMAEVQALPEGVTQWATIYAVTNYFGSIPWQHFYINFTDFFSADDFRIRFKFSGDGEETAIWTLDNIRVHNVCPGPANIVASLDDEHTIQVAWNGGKNSENGSAFSTYRLYRDYNGSGFELRLETTDTQVLDEVQAGGKYCYRVSSVYNDQGSECESSQSDSSCVITHVGIEEPALDDIIIYPNPANGNITLKSSHYITSVTFYNALGVQLNKIENLNGNYTADVSGYCPGIYLLEINVDGNILRKKIILQ